VPYNSSMKSSAVPSRSAADDDSSTHQSAADEDEQRYPGMKQWDVFSDEGCIGLDGAWWAREESQENVEQKSRKEIDAELNTVLENWDAIKDTTFILPRAQASKSESGAGADERSSVSSRQHESFADRVVRMEDNRAFLDEAAAAAAKMADNPRRKGGTFDEGPRGQVEQDVTRSVERVRAKLKAVLTARKDFLEGAEQDFEDRD